MSNARAVIVGVGQVRNRPGLDSAEWKPEEPAQLMATALQRAAADAGRPQLLAEAQFVGCIPPMAWSYDDLPGRVAELAGAAPREKLEPPGGGEGPILLLDDIANRIADGELEIALLAGAECVYSRRRARAENVKLPWTPGGDGFPRFLASMKPFANALEARHGVRQPVDMYPLYENALRAKAGRTIEAHQRFVSELMARYSAVAAKNPFSWFPEPRTAEEIRTVSAKNRWIGFPYPKLMNALMEVDQAAAAIVMSERAADRLGIAPAKRVAFLGGASANDGWSAAERVDLASSPAYRAAARAAQGHAGARGRGRRAVRSLLLLPVRDRVRAGRPRPVRERSAQPDPDRRARAPRRPGQQLRDARAGQHRSASAGRRGQGRLGLGSGHERDQARDRRALHRPAPDRGRRRALDPRVAAERRVRGAGAGRRAAGPGRGRELHRHVRPRQRAGAQRRLPAAPRRPAQRRARRGDARAVPPPARGGGRRSARASVARAGEAPNVFAPG